jgi:glutamate-1-semialdehyde 2,1-aminomutase
MIVGHAHPEVIEAVKAAADKGTSFGAPTLAETVLAQKITIAYHSIEKVRMVSSGTEAVMSAVRLARAYTGRDMIIKMAGGYHGHSDSLLASAGSGVAEAARPSSEGVPADFAKLTVVVPYNDAVAVKAAFEVHAGKIAAVLVEPVAANVGVIGPEPGYLEAIREICTSNKAVLIFDEVITGFRLAYGGAQERFGVNADLTCLGKIVGGGMPAAAFGGKAEIMDMLAPLGPVYQAGTLSGNPLATAAAIKTLEILEDQKRYAELEEKSAALEEGIAKAAAEAGIEITINRAGSLMSVFFTGRPVLNYEQVKLSNIKQFKKFFSEMLNAGIYIAPSAFEAMFVSLAHSSKDIEHTIEAAKYSFKRIK